MKVDDTIRHDDCAQFSSSSPLRPSCTGVAACTAHIKCGCTECTPAPLQWRCAVRRQVENIHYSRLLSKGRTNPKVFGTVLPPSVLALVLALGRSSSTAVPPSNMSNQSISSSPISRAKSQWVRKKPRNTKPIKSSENHIDLIKLTSNWAQILNCVSPRTS